MPGVGFYVVILVHGQCGQRKKEIGAKCRILCSDINPWAMWATEKRDRCQLQDFMLWHQSMGNVGNGKKR